MHCLQKYTELHSTESNAPSFGTKFRVKSLGNAPPIPVLGGVGLNIDRCIKSQDLSVLKLNLCVN